MEIRGVPVLELESGFKIFEKQVNPLPT